MFVYLWGKWPFIKCLDQDCPVRRSQSPYGLVHVQALGWREVWISHRIEKGLCAWRKRTGRKHGKQSVPNVRQEAFYLRNTVLCFGRLSNKHPSQDIIPFHHHAWWDELLLERLNSGCRERLSDAPSLMSGICC